MYFANNEITLKCILVLSGVLYGLMGNVETSIPHTKASGISGPEVHYASIKELNASDIRPNRKRAPQVMYQVSMDNETFTLTLRANSHLYTPGCLIHRYRLNGTKEIFPCAREEMDCYYIGSSDAHNESWVAANICDGLRGVIRFDNISLFIEPVNLSNSSLLPNSNSHAVYRYQGGKHVCALQDKDFDLRVVHGRRIREVETHYIETRLVIDPTMYHFHKGYENVLQYTMLAFNMATNLFRDPSIQTNIFLILRELHVFEIFDNFTSELTENAHITLRKFCDWQSGHVTEADCSVLLTRLDLENNDEVRDKSITGLSKPRGICNKEYQCAIVEDHGPAMGITIAHEIGHLMGMNHDNTDGDVGIMSQGGWSGSQAFEWSRRSANELSLSLRKGDLTCLNNMPTGMKSTEQQDTQPDILPGTLYSADRQCQMMFDESVLFFRYSNNNLPRSFEVCQNLLCGDTRRNLSQPLMDGTDCNNTRTWCQHGKCVAIDSDIPPVDGAWSKWTEDYTPCSRSCGGGVQVKRRKCNNPPPQYGGKECTGMSTEAKICNIQACTTDYRSLQCNEAYAKYLQGKNVTHDLRLYDRPGTTVTPDLGFYESLSLDNESCKMRCRNGERVKPLGLYKDGTECMTDEVVPFARCVDGQCRKIGCDGKSDSGLQFDVCGVCNGSGDLCVKQSGDYKRGGGAKRYTFIVKIPKDSSGVYIEQRTRRSFLSIVVNGVRVLNADFNPSDSGVFNLFGVQIRYFSFPESVQIMGRLQADIDVEVFQLEPQWIPDIHYTYYVPKPQQMMYAWAEIPNPICSRSCGGGTTTYDTRCWSPTGKVVEDMYCDILSKPNILITSCNTKDCPPSWKIGEWEPCSMKCGIGQQTRPVSCVAMVHGVEKEISATYCKSVTMPTQDKPCIIEECPTGIWQTGNWSECLASCGEGYKKRRVFCASVSNVSFEVDDIYCDAGVRPQDKERCFNDFCYVLDGYCVDNDTRCGQYYQTDITACVGAYSKWMRQQCPKTCRYCLNGEIRDIDNCRLVDPSVNACSNPLYSTWMRQNCPESCKICQDYMDCTVYDANYCEHPNYVDYMRSHCPMTCGLCTTSYKI